MKEFRLIKISADTPFQRGMQYGEQAVSEIHTCISTYRDRFLATRSLGWKTVREMSMAHLPCIEAMMPDMLEEAKGIAQGAGVDLEDIMVLNCRYEILHFPNPKECTAFALKREATADGKVYVGQNWDQRCNLLEHTLLLDITEEETGNRIFGMTEAGQLIRNGMNTRGVAQCSNSLHSVLDDNGVGIPSNFVRRKLLTMGSIREMVDLIRAAQRSVSVNYCLGSRENLVADVEAVPGHTVRLDGREGILTHANNLLVNQDMDTFRDERFRGERLMDLLALRRGKIDLAYIQNCLRDHYGHPGGICSHPSAKNKQWQTNASIIYSLDDGKAWICYGPPCQGEYKEYQL